MLRVLLLATLLIGSASAHVPTFAQAGTSPDAAFLVDEPDQSRVFYGELNEGQQHWFRFERQAGEAIDVSLHLPARETERPALWVVGPGIAGEGPSQNPPGLGGQMAPVGDELDVEPFTPLAMRAVSEWSQPAPESGAYYVVIEADAATAYSVAIGRGESFTVIEWVAIPVQRIGIMAWAGIPWPLALAGEVLVAGAALAVAWRRETPMHERLGWVAAGAMVGTAGTTLVLAFVAAIQGGIAGALLVPFVFAGVAFGVGVGAYRAVRGGRAWVGIAWAVGGLAAWAGLIIGPAAMVAWSLWRLQLDKSNGRKAMQERNVRD